MTLGKLFPQEDYRFSMRFERGTPQDFFAPSPNSSKLLRERQHWLAVNPAIYAGLLPEGIPLLAETIQLVHSWGAVSCPESSWYPNEPGMNCVALGRCLEPDFALLKVDPGGNPCLVGGVVCFPSHWSLAEKLGQPLESIHGVVPGLNAAVGKRINSFLTHLKPGIAWLRSNWGLARTAEWNDHPSRSLPRLGPQLTLQDVWLRLEHQALIALPQTGGILFGIRVEIEPIEHVAKDTALAEGLRRALETMPEEMARYKGLAEARPALLAILDR